MFQIGRLDKEVIFRQADIEIAVETVFMFFFY